MSTACTRSRFIVEILALVNALTILPASGCDLCDRRPSDRIQLGSTRFGQSDDRVLSGSPATAIGEIVKRLVDGLVVSGISNWPVAISRRKPVRRPAVDVLYPLSFLQIFFLLHSIRYSLSSYPYNSRVHFPYRLVPALLLQ